MATTALAVAAEPDSYEPAQSLESSRIKSTGQKRPRVTPQETAIALTLHRKGFSLNQIGQQLHRHHDTIRQAIEPFMDSTELAQQRLRGAALQLVERVIEGADVDQALDVLSRPNVGVLQPVAQQGNSSNVQVNIGILPPGCEQGVAVIEASATEVKADDSSSK